MMTQRTVKSNLKVTMKSYVKIALLVFIDKESIMAF